MLSIQERVRSSLESATLQFSGELQCEQQQLVVVSLSSPSNSTKESFLIDGKPVQLDPLDRTGRVLVAAGVHQISWSVMFANSDTSVSCSLRNAQSGKRLEVNAPTEANSFDSPSDLTVSLLRRAR